MDNKENINNNVETPKAPDNSVENPNQVQNLLKSLNTKKPEHMRPVNESLMITKTDDIKK